MDTEPAMEDKLTMHGQWWGSGREAVQTTGDWEARTGERSEPFRPRSGAAGALRD